MKCEEFLLDCNEKPIFLGDRVQAIQKLSPIGWVGKNEYVHEGEKFIVTDLDMKGENLYLDSITDYRGGLPADAFERANITEKEAKKIHDNMANYFEKEEAPINFSIDKTGLVHRRE